MDSPRLPVCVLGWPCSQPAVPTNTKTPANKGVASGSAAATQLTDEQKEIQKAMAELPEADRKLAIAQATCPVSGEALGTMGMPFKVTVKERDVFLCCDGCKDKIEKDPDAYLAKLDAKKAK